MKRIALLLILLCCLCCCLIPAYAEEPPQNGIVGKWYPCGDDLRFMIVYQPIMTRSQSYMTAEGTFILFRAWIADTGSRPIAGLKSSSFSLLNTNGSVPVEYPLAPGFTYVTSQAWELGLPRDPIAPQGQTDTFLVFDVNGQCSDHWVLRVAPVERGTDTPLCDLRITLPAINCQ